MPRLFTSQSPDLGPALPRRGACRPGRPSARGPAKLNAGARALLETALARSPVDDAYPVTIWTVTDLPDVLGRHGWSVSTATVSWTLPAMASRYRRPRHDLTHRQDADAVASAMHVLDELQQRGIRPGLASGLSPGMRATSTPIPSWSTSGTAGAVQ